MKAAGEFIVLQRLAVIQVESPSKSLSEKTSK